MPSGRRKPTTPADHPAEERVGEDLVGKQVLLAAAPETIRAIDPARRVTSERAAWLGT